MSLIDAAYSITNAPLNFLLNVSPDKAVREASEASSKKASEYNIVANMRTDIFEALKHAEKNTDLSRLSDEGRRLLERQLVRACLVV